MFFYCRCVVWTGDNRVFFFNPSTRQSVWERPIELKNRPDVDNLMKAPPKPEDSQAPSQQPQTSTAATAASSSGQEKRPIDNEADKTVKKLK